MCSKQRWVRWGLNGKTCKEVKERKRGNCNRLLLLLLERRVLLTLVLNCTDLICLHQLLPFSGEVVLVPWQDSCLGNLSNRRVLWLAASILCLCKHLSNDIHRWQQFCQQHHGLTLLIEFISSSFGMCKECLHLAKGWWWMGWVWDVQVQQLFEEHIGCSNSNCGKLLIIDFQQLHCQHLAFKTLVKCIWQVHVYRLNNGIVCLSSSDIVCHLGIGRFGINGVWLSNLHDPCVASRLQISLHDRPSQNIVHTSKNWDMGISGDLWVRHW